MKFNLCIQFQIFKINLKYKQSAEMQGPIDEENQSKPSLEQSVNRYSAISSVTFLFLISIATYLHYSRRDQPFKPFIDTSSYYPQQNPKIYAGQVHFARIPVQYWDHRIKMIKAMGLNTLSVYIMWNYHEIERGKFDFETQNKNLSLFLQLAEKNNMKVLIRPGPYVCAEWDFGGLPSRLLADPQVQLRSLNKKFMEQTTIYFTAVAKIIKQHIWSQQNPNKCIIMLQIQNQYGFFGTDLDYMLQIRKIWRNLNIITAQYYVDWFINIRKSHWQGANIGLNDAFTQFQIDYIKTTLEPKGMVFGGQIYSGWITYWGLPKLEKRDPYEKLRQYEFLMSHNLSYSMYMVHGGTNFGLTAGANSRYVDKLGFAGQITSYDYDAPINQQGSATLKYNVFRDSIKKYANWQVPEVPAPIPMKKIPEFRLNTVMSLFENIDWEKPSATSKKPIVFQSNELKMFNLGIVIYQITLPMGYKDTIQIQAHDVAFVIMDMKFIQMFDRTEQKFPNITLECKSYGPCTVRFIVEAMGHINYDVSMKNDWKGIVSFKSLSGNQQQFQWKMYKVPIDDNKLLDWGLKGENMINLPVLLKSEIEIQQPADTYFNVKKFYKGYVWVNGRNLGRYWQKGPQFKLYCPGVWLKKGKNIIYILDLKYSGDWTARGEMTLEQNQGDF